MARLTGWILVGGIACLGLVRARPADAGCGCDKPPPPPAAVRPAFASPGSTITLFDGDIREGRTYSVRFEDADGYDRDTVQSKAVKRRDLADGVMKPQLSVVVPDIAPGPTKIRVSYNGDSISKISSSDFTVLQAALSLPEANVETVAKCYRAAVGADGRLYIPLNISGISQHMVFSGVGEGYPLLFDGSDISIYNTQGFLMQLLGPKQASIYAITDPGSPDSFELTYDRHEFVTYQSEHVHVRGLALDPNDPAWHVDGTRHIDHDNLVIAIQGELEGRGAPRAGTTWPFDLSIATTMPDGSSRWSKRRVITWSHECDGWWH